MRRLLAFSVLMLSVAAQPALPVPGGSVIFTDSNPPSVTLHDVNTGSSTVLTNSGTLVTPAGVTVAADRDVIFTDWLGLSMYRVDFLGNLTTVASGLLNNPNRVIEDFRVELA